MKQRKAVVAPNSPSKFTIPIELNSDGTVTANFEETLKQVLSEIDTSGFLEQFYDMAFEKCISIAKEMQEGNVTLQVKLKEPNCAELSVTWESNEVYLPGDGEGSESRYLELSIGWIVQVMIYTPEYKLAGEIVKYASVACVGCIAGWALVELGAVAGAGLGTITTIYSALTLFSSF